MVPCAPRQSRHKKWPPDLIPYNPGSILTLITNQKGYYELIVNALVVKHLLKKGSFRSARSRAENGRTVTPSGFTKAGKLVDSVNHEHLGGAPVYLVLCV